MEGEEQAILAWVNTFETVPKCNSFGNLFSGYVIGLMLSEMCVWYLKFDFAITTCFLESQHTLLISEL